MLFTIIYINNKKVLETTDVLEEWYNDANVSEFFNFICARFPLNDWRDIICDDIKKVDDSLFIYFTTM